MTALKEYSVIRCPTSVARLSSGELGYLDPRDVCLGKNGWYYVKLSATLQPTPLTKPGKTRKGPEDYIVVYKVDGNSLFIEFVGVKRTFHPTDAPAPQQYVPAQRVTANQKGKAIKPSPPPRQIAAKPAPAPPAPKLPQPRTNGKEVAVVANKSVVKTEPGPGQPTTVEKANIGKQGNWFVKLDQPVIRNGSVRTIVAPDTPVYPKQAKGLPGYYELKVVGKYYWINVPRKPGRDNWMTVAQP